MIEVSGYNDALAHAVLQLLDAHDYTEIRDALGRDLTPLQLYSHWRDLQPHCLASVVLRHGVSLRPFALLAVANTGMAGVATASFLSCYHKTNRRLIAEAAVHFRKRIPGFCDTNGIRRIETRCSLDHPTARHLLEALGFHREAVMPGFGRDGRATFLQYAYLALPPAPKGIPDVHDAQNAENA